VHISVSGKHMFFARWMYPRWLDADIAEFELLGVCSQ
jgi:hypothetical protein